MITRFKAALALHRKKQESFKSLVDKSDPLPLNLQIRALAFDKNLSQIEDLYIKQNKSKEIAILLIKLLIAKNDIAKAKTLLHYQIEKYPEDLLIGSVATLINLKENKTESLNFIDDRIRGKDNYLAGELLEAIETIVYNKNQNDKGDSFNEGKILKAFEYILKILDMGSVAITWITSHLKLLILSITNLEKYRLRFHIINGDRYQIVNKLEKASGHYKKASSIDKDDPQLLESLFILYIKKQLPDQAEKILTKLKSKKQYNEQLFLNELAELAWLKSDLKSAKNFYQQLVKIDPTNYFNFYRLGIANIRTEKLDKDKNFAKALTLADSEGILKSRLKTALSQLN